MKRSIAEVIGMTRLVGQEIVDKRKFDNLQAFVFRDVDEEEVGNKHSLHLLLLSCSPDTCLILGSHIRFVAESSQSLTTCFFRISANNSDKPMAVGYAYGVVNFLS